MLNIFSNNKFSYAQRRRKRIESAVGVSKNEISGNDFQNILEMISFFFAKFARLSDLEKINNVSAFRVYQEFFGSFWLKYNYETYFRKKVFDYYV